MHLIIRLLLRKDLCGIEYTSQPKTLARLQNLALLTDMYTDL
jgi:hypothetical protein